ncbi:hypothetical protein N7519_003558 [Penicillium mononematosum]|uniref:uncharacterized protein n=1 Tax=Penicillium mononematosum TaxID=268346 RepID=UPI002548C040|nr:uncharacterized protein N7519_003558 [Penicillium mononematosum]KAJ6188650.1 hypothetical protein N7519_003558 [Penicillium mononematosum]
MVRGKGGHEGGERYVLVALGHSTDSGQLVGPVWYQGRKVMVVEYESSRDGEEVGDDEEAGENSAVTD